MTTTANSIQTSARINLVDSLRGFAVVGIIIIHFLEHMNFFMFPQSSAFEQGLWDTVFFLGGSKMYAIFSLLFGFSCYIQHHNEEKRGGDFRLRFAWRMLLLFLWGMLDLMFFNGDILVVYAVLGLLLIPLMKAKDKVLWLLAGVLLLQPIELGYLVAAQFCPEVKPMDVGLGTLWGELASACAHGSILDVAKVNWAYGLQINFGWALENGRLTQTLLLFIVGMLLGRKRLFINEGSHLFTWKKVLIGSVVTFAVTQLLVLYVPASIESPTMKHSANILFSAWRNLSMTIFYVSGLSLLYYKTGLHHAIDQLKYLGKMSLTNYLIQSIVGGFIFYNWGLSLYSMATHGYSFLFAVVFLVPLYFFCRYWSTHFRRGPLEEIWYRLTWIGRK